MNEINCEILSYCSLCNKIPFGAVAEETEITIHIHLTEKVKNLVPYLRVFRENNEPLFETELFSHIEKDSIFQSISEPFFASKCPDKKEYTQSNTVISDRQNFYDTNLCSQNPVFDNLCFDNSSVENNFFYRHFDYEKQPECLYKDNSENFCKQTASSYSCRFSIPHAGLYFYDFILKDENGVLLRFGHKKHFAVCDHNAPKWQLTVYHKDFHTPDWIKGGIMYQIFPDRFAKSEDFVPLPVKNTTERFIHKNWNDTPHSFLTNKDYKAQDFFMGNLKGITESISYLKNLHINTIYLNPVFESSDNHRYSTGDYRKIDGFLGSNEDFEQMTASLSENGIHTIVDGVFSHCGWDSIYFNRFGHYESIGAYQSQQSKFFSWFSFEEFPDKYHSWWGFENLPAFCKENPSYENFITNEQNGILSFWQNKGIHGWRLDVADELPDQFLEAIYRTAKKQNPDTLILSEVWEDASNKISYNHRRHYLLGRQSDCVMNYPWRTAIIAFMKYGNAQDFSYEITSICENYPKPVLHTLMNILSTHDTVRIINELGITHEVPLEERGAYHLTEEELQRGITLEKMAAFLQFTLPGVPCIYYGDEVGLDGFADPFNRKTYPYGKENTNLLSYYQSLCQFRTTYRTDFQKDLRLVCAQNNCFAFARGNLICIANRGAQPSFIECSGKKQLLFGNQNSSFSKWGIVIPPCSFACVKATE